MYIDSLPIRERKVTDYLIVQTEGESTARVQFDYTALGLATASELATLKSEMQSMKEGLQQSIGDAIGAVYVPKGSVAFKDLPTLQSSKVGWVYNITDAFTTTADFLEGASKSYPAGTNVVCAEYELGVKKWDVLGSLTDMSVYALKTEVSAVDTKVATAQARAELADTAAQTAQAAATKAQTNAAAAQTAADEAATAASTAQSTADGAKSAVDALTTRVNTDFLEKD